MFKYNIPTAAWAEFDDFHQARDYIASQKTPLVIKADGLAAGKGVIIAPDKEAAINAARDMLVENAFGSAGHKILVEEFLSGEEISVMAFCDGEHIVPMVSAQDHKRAFDNDMGPNTGGMGAYSPSPLYDEVLERRIMEEILVPTCVKMKEEGRPYKGVLYAGLMITESGPKVLEYNARFGDPETQVVLARLKSDLMDIIAAVNEGGIHKINIEWRHEAAACVVMASGGYPGEYEKGYEIKGINKAENKDVLVFHSGTVARNNKIFSNGGRVLGITALGAGIREAVDHAYEAVREIDFTAAFYRKDIGAKALREC
jgi:phosphoribosylamine--glycine ligase